MNLQSIRVKGLKPFVSEQFVNLESLPGKLIALTGSNGSGKSTLLNFFPAAVIPSNKKFLFMPGRGSRTTLASLSVSRDSFVEVKFEYGDQGYTIRHSIDGQTGKTECSLTDANGNAVLKGKSGVTEYLAWASEHLPPPEVFFGSVFSGQRTRGMLGMDPAERKQLILKVLGLDRYEKLASLASEHKRKSEQALAVASGKLSELKGDSIAYCEEQIAKWTAELRTAEESLRLGNVTLADLRSKNEETQKLCAEYDAQALRRRELNERINGLRTRVAQVDAKVMESRSLEAEREQIESAVARYAELSALLESLRSEESELRVKTSELEGKQSTLYHRERDAAARRSGLERSITNAGKLLADRERIQIAVVSLSKAEGDYAQARADSDAVFTALQELQRTSLVSADGRIAGLRTGLRLIAGNEVPSPADTASTILGADDAMAKQSEDRPRENAALTDSYHQAERRCSDAGKQLQAVKELAARLPEIETAEKAKAEAETELASLDRSGFEVERVALLKEGDAVIQELTSCRLRIKGLTGEVDTLRLLTAKAVDAQQAKSRIEDLLHQRSGLEKELEETEHKRDGIVLEEPPETINLVPYENAVKQAQVAVTDASTHLTIAQDGLTRAKATEARRIELEADVRQSGQDAAEWKRLADDLGIKGIPGLVTDAAGPELTTLANDFLRASGDTRFSLRVVTTKEDSTGKRELETCEIMISDCREVEPKTGASVGEESFINKALAFALTALASKQVGLRRPTIIDDEGDAALSKEYVPMYVPMLRRAADVMDASRIIFVSHRPESLSMADATLVVDQGVITVG